MLTPNVARSLAAMSAKDYGREKRACIHLEGVRDLTPEVISELTKSNSEHEKHPFDLHFGRVERLSLDMAREFREYEGWITISAEETSPDARDLLLERRDFRDWLE